MGVQRGGTFNRSTSKAIAASNVFQNQECIQVFIILLVKKKKDPSISIFSWFPSTAGRTREEQAGPRGTVMFLNSGIWCHAEEGDTCSASVAPCHAASAAARWGKETGKRASGASPATWLNLSLCVSPGSVRAMREQGRLHWVTATLDSHPDQAGKVAGCEVLCLGKHAPVTVVLRRLHNMFRLPVSWSDSYLGLVLPTFIQKNKADALLCDGSMPSQAP